MPEVIADISFGFASHKAPKKRRPERSRPVPGRHTKEIITTSNVDRIRRGRLHQDAAREGGDTRTQKASSDAPTPLSLVPQGIPPQPTEVAMWIVIPTHNRPEKFQECLGSVIRQLGPRDHIVAIASGFKMFEDVKKASFNPRVTGVLIGDVTVNVARSTAMGVIPEDAVVVEIGDNDYMRLHALDRIRKAFEDPGIGVVYGNLAFVGNDGKPRGAIIRKPAWSKGVMRRRCEVRGLHAYRKIVYDRYGGWHESETPAGDHANAIRWEDSGVKFVSVGGAPLVNCTYDPKGMSVARKQEQHMNSQAFARGEYRRNYSVGMVCWSMAGRRTKMLALLDEICDPERVRIYASARNRYSVASDTDDHIQRRTLWWMTVEDLAVWLPEHEVAHLFVDRLDFAANVAVGGRRVVVDVCDLRTQRTGDHEYKDEEALCTSPNAWLMFVSEGHRDYICEKYGLPIERTHIVPNLPMKSWRPEEPLEEKDKVPNSIVYYGGITAKTGHVAAYRYYYDIFKAFKDAGISVHIYPAGSRAREVQEGYKEFHIHDRFAHRDIYRVLRRYSCGFAGYEDRAGCPPVSHEYAMRCYPNKATDYMMAGIPTVSYALGLAEKDVKNWGVCVPKGRGHEIVDAYRQATAMQIDYRVWQEAFCMESQAPKIVEAYDWASEGRR